MKANKKEKAAPSGSMCWTAGAVCHSPVLQAVVHDVPLVRRLHKSSPGQEDRGWCDGANHQVERFVQVDFTWGQMPVSSHRGASWCRGMFACGNMLTRALLLDVIAWNRLHRNQVLGLCIWGSTEKSDYCEFCAQTYTNVWQVRFKNHRPGQNEAMKYPVHLNMSATGTFLSVPEHMPLCKFAIRWRPLEEYIWPHVGVTSTIHLQQGHYASTWIFRLASVLLRVQQSIELQAVFGQKTCRSLLDGPYARLCVWKELSRKPDYKREAGLFGGLCHPVLILRAGGNAWAMKSHLSAQGDHLIIICPNIDILDFICCF